MPKTDQCQHTLSRSGTCNPERMLRGVAFLLAALAWSGVALGDLAPRRQVHPIISLVRDGKLAEVETMLDSDASLVSSRDYDTPSCGWREAMDAPYPPIRPNR